jgi:RecB family exonuclease
LAETAIPPVVAPRRTRLVRADGLRAFQHAIVEAAFGRDTIEALRSCCVILPTRAAAAALRRTIEDARLIEPGTASALPVLATRSEFYAVLHERLGGEPSRLSDFEREALLRRSAREVAADLAPPFQLRPGLVVEILRFYDELRRRQRTVDAYERVMVGELEPGAAYDRGADRLLRQTRFLAATFRRYEAAIDASGAVDEHQLRARLLASPARRPVQSVIVAVGDEASEDGGLWSADFDLLSRLPGLESIDVLVTEEQLAAGLYERLLTHLPGIVEEPRATAAPPPILVAPPATPLDAPLFFTLRDREEELADIARVIKARGHVAGRFGVVFQRPLPYLYLAHHVLPSGGIGYEASDALPLAAEPYAAALDAVFSCLTSDFTRDALVDLLRLPQFAFASDGTRLQMRETAALDHLLLDAKYLGGSDALAAIAGDVRASRAGDEARRALAAALEVCAQLQTIVGAASASRQLETLIEFLKRYERLPPVSASWRERHLRARAAVHAALDGLRDAHARFDDTAIPPAELSAAVRRWIEGQTFAPRTGVGGIHLVDADAARFARFDELRIVGLVERDWPVRTARSIFYPGWLLVQMGWPAEPSRLASARAAFRDLLRLPTRRVSVSTFHLDDDALMAPSTFLEELEPLGARAERPPVPPPQRIFVHEALAFDPVIPAVHDEALAWLRLRVARTEEPVRRSGDAGPQTGATFAVSHLERYLECPFKYFAAFVLRLEEERDEDVGMRATERGQFLHDLLMEFFRRWQETGRAGLTPENAVEALTEFRALAGERLATLSPLDRALEEGRLLGTAAAPGIAERLFAFELEREVPVVERLLEHRLEGEYTFSAGDRQRTLRIRAQADRIDLLADGTLRIVDYKLGRAPRPSRALQLPIYGICAAQSLEGHQGRTWRVGEAGYVAFGERDVFRPLGGGSGGVARALAEGQERLLNAVDGIERGEFPPRPDEPFLCTYCAYAAVCRKDYVGDE